MTNFDLAVKYVKINQGSSFEQIMIGSSPSCYKVGIVILRYCHFGVSPVNYSDSDKPSSVQIEHFLKDFSIYGHDGHFGHMTWTIYIKFCSVLSKEAQYKICFEWPSGF